MWEVLSDAIPVILIFYLGYLTRLRWYQDIYALEGTLKYVL